MKLIIVRDQAKGLFGGVKFELRAQVQLTKEEADLVNKYRAGGEVLMLKKTKTILGMEVEQAVPQRLTIQHLVDGQTFKCKSISEILSYEADVKESCGSFKVYLEMMKNFGGQEVVEY